MPLGWSLIQGRGGGGAKDGELWAWSGDGREGKPHISSPPPADGLYSSLRERASGSGVPTRLGGSSKVVATCDTAKAGGVVPALANSWGSRGEVASIALLLFCSRRSPSSSATSMPRVPRCRKTREHRMMTRKGVVTFILSSFCLSREKKNAQSRMYLFSCATSTSGIAIFQSFNLSLSSAIFVIEPAYRSPAAKVLSSQPPHPHRRPLPHAPHLQLHRKLGGRLGAMVAPAPRPWLPR